MTSIEDFQTWTLATMSEESSNTFRDDRGRFVNGGKAGPGRPRGSRNKLGEEFLDDLIAEWRATGKKALAVCAAREPTQFVKIVSNVLPKEVLSMALNVNASFDFTEVEDARAFLAAYRRCQVEPLEDQLMTQVLRDGD